MTTLASAMAVASPRKLFVVGDSISIAYGPALKSFVAGTFVYDRKRDSGEALADLDRPVGANGGDSRMVLAYLKELAADRSFRTDVLLVNCGLHDIKTDRAKGTRQVDPEEYISNLHAIVALSRKAGWTLVWVTSTPVDDAIHNARNVGFYRYNRDVEEYNLLARRVFEAAHVPVIDLYAFSRTFPADAYSDHVHYRPDYASRQAAFIGEALMRVTTSR